MYYHSNDGYGTPGIFYSSTECSYLQLTKCFHMTNIWSVDNTPDINIFTESFETSFTFFNYSEMTCYDLQRKTECRILIPQNINFCPSHKCDVKKSWLTFSSIGVQVYCYGIMILCGTIIFQPVYDFEIIGISLYVWLFWLVNSCHYTPSELPTALCRLTFLWG